MDVVFFVRPVLIAFRARRHLTVIVCVSLYSSWLVCMFLPSTLMYRFEVNCPQIVLQVEGVTVQDVPPSHRLPLETAVTNEGVVPMLTLNSV